MQDATRVVHGIEQVCPHHADLIDDEQVKGAKQLDFVARKTPLAINLPRRSGKVQSQGQLKKRCSVMPPALIAATPVGAVTIIRLELSSLIWCEKRGVACAGLAGEKNILACIAHVFECEIELGI